MVQGSRSTSNRHLSHPVFILISMGPIQEAAATIPVQVEHGSLGEVQGVRGTQPIHVEEHRQLQSLPPQTGYPTDKVSNP